MSLSDILEVEGNMGLLTGVEPTSVFYFFEEICRIPHGSGNVQALSDYVKAFAKKRGLDCIQDEWGNIVIVKEAASGYEQEKTIILQGHMDMVAVKEPELDIDMKTEPLRLKRDGNRLYAEGTSLGGDDGIAVAFALALLDAQDIPHPRLEVILTVDEETGMEGAKKIDLSMLQGKRMINLDQEEEGILLTSCAGGARVDVRIPVYRQVCPNQGSKRLSVKVKGLQGGHSGSEIIRGGGNANCLLGRVLYELTEEIPVKLLDLAGGLADNAIPREACADIVISSADETRFYESIKRLEQSIQSELASKDEGFAIEVSPVGALGKAGGETPADAVKDGAVQWDALTDESAKNAIACLVAMPNGVQAMSADVEGLVETSLNLGIMKLHDGELLLEFAVRSSVNSAKEALCRKIQAVAQLAGAAVSVRGDYPGWAYRKYSPLRDKMVRVYEELFSEKPQLQAIHAGLECGLLADKIEGLDCVSMGPDMKNIHTAQEYLDIASTQRTWQYLTAILADKG